MAVAFVASSSGTAAAATTLSSGNVTPGAGSDRGAVAYFAYADGADNGVTSFDINGSAATAVPGTTVADGGGRTAEVGWYYATGTPTTAYDADVVIDATCDDLFCGIFAVTGMDTTDPTDNEANQVASYFPSTFNGTSATSATDDMVFDVCIVAGFSATTWTGTPDTANFPIDDSSGEAILRAGYEAGAATVTIGYDWTDSSPSAIHSYFNVNAAAGGGGGANPKGVFGLPLNGPFGHPLG